MTADADTRLTPRLFPTAGFQIITEHGVHLKIFHAWMERVTGRKIDWHVGPRRQGDPPVLIASSQRARDILAWRPEHGTLEEMVGSAWEWRRAHPRGYIELG